MPGTNLMPPGIPERTEYNPLPDHEPGTTDADKAKQLLADSGNENYPIKFLYSQDDPISVDVKDAIVKGLKAGWLRPAAVRDHRRGLLHAACRPEHDDQRPVRRMVLGLADRLVLVPAGVPVDQPEG